MAHVVSSALAAFMSYVHFNDLHDRGYLTALCARLRGEVRALTARDFSIFQDTTHIEVGHQWRGRIVGSLDSCIILIPIVTPHYFKSSPCREEFERFLAREAQLGRDDLVLPIYYITCPQIENPKQWLDDPIAQELARRQREDWRPYRGRSINSRRTQDALTVLALRIAKLLEEVDARGVELSMPTRQPISRKTLRANIRPDDLHRDLAPAHGPPFDLALLQPAEPFFGRMDDLAWVIGCLDSVALPGIVALDGAQGIGKTALASAAVRHMRANKGRFTDGVAVVHCDRATDVAAVIGEVLGRFNPGRRPPLTSQEDELAEEAKALFTGKDALVVLEDIPPELAVNHVIGVLHHAGASLLMTSRQQLPLPPNMRRTLEPLPEADSINFLTQHLERRQDDAEAK